MKDEDITLRCETCGYGQFNGAWFCIANDIEREEIDCKMNFCDSLFGYEPDEE